MRARFIWGSVVLVALILGVVGGYMIGTGQFRPEHTETTFTSTNPDRIEFPNVELENLNIDTQAGDIQGVIQNKTNHSLTIDSIEVDYFDSTGKLLGTSVEPGEPKLAAARSETFGVVGFGDDVSNATKLEIKIKYK